MTLFYTIAFLLLAALGAVMYLRIRKLEPEARGVYALWRQDGQIGPDVSEEAFVEAWKRAYFPRAIGYVIALLAVPLILFPIMSVVVNWVWFTLWYYGAPAGQRMEALDTGTIVHGLIGIILVCAATIACAIPIVRRYHARRPDSFEAELRRLEAGPGAVGDA